MFMKSFLREFQSWYWNCDFDDVELQAAFDATDAAATPDEFQRAFLVLLRSEGTVARGVALDFFDRAAATSRFGEANPFEPCQEEVPAVAREMLRHPPRPGDDIAFEGADQTSALRALKNDAGPEDAKAVLAVLRRRPGRTAAPTGRASILVRGFSRPIASCASPPASEPTGRHFGPCCTAGSFR